jgi:hypothetical protein
MEKEVETILIFSVIVLIFAAALLIPHIVRSCQHPVGDDLENAFEVEAHVTY